MLRLTRPEEIKPYLSDASQFSGTAEGTALPEDEKEVVEFLKEANAQKIPVTVSGGRTGLVGGAVPQGGWVLSMEKLSRVLEVNPRKGKAWARVQPGIPLGTLSQAVMKDSLFYPPDPTGPFAFFGGTVATNASGPRSFKYGDTRRFVRRLRVVLATGEILDLKRGQILAPGPESLKIPLGNRTLHVPFPHYEMPRVKHATGYFASPGMDAIDLFIGSEGTLGVITEIEVALLPRPEAVLAFVAFFQSEEASWRFARAMRGRPKEVEPRVLEYFDSGSLEFLAPKFPPIPREARACLFIEQEVGAASPQKEWFRLFEKHGALPEIWEGDTPEKEEEFRRFRSALPLEIRDFLAAHHQVKIGTDTCVPPERFEELMQFHRRKVEEAGLAAVTFGHIGESHVHLNILPRTAEEAECGRRLYPELVERAVSLGGTFSAEHGVGKLKRRYLRKLYGEKGIEEMRAVKRALDPNGILGRGNLFEIE